MKKFIYKSYARVVNGRRFYFVKKFETYSDAGNLPPILVSMGMHHDFMKACELARVDDPDVIQDLLAEFTVRRSPEKVSSVSQLQRQEERKVSSVWYPHYWISKLKWANI